MPQNPRHALSKTTIGVSVVAGVFWILVVLAVVDMRAGNPTAINGVIGCAFGAVITTASALGLARLDRKYGP